ncbi:hypothetical protein [Neobacillus sp. PS3-40]|jgi:large-conductance mechanosensitive channel|uniref:hypothetical protein n=1 Tax=Neobacillus sp. PS3-40 TaxID=3070679 RepID=UPI0027DF38EE|nr:hypothetical protein [Neobacillus sp. PS3-40]WML43990.1 hypothetical protein RCG20_19760 [Neobacillus sp. PS3-40]
MFTNAAPEGGIALLMFLPIILYLALTAFCIYFIIKVIKFMNAKTKSDQERNQKMDELVKIVSQVKNIE